MSPFSPQSPTVQLGQAYMGSWVKRIQAQAGCIPALVRIVSLDSAQSNSIFGIGDRADTRSAAEAVPLRVSIAPARLCTSRRPRGTFAGLGRNGRKGVHERGE